jgi:Tol biopolymer transport system component
LALGCFVLLAASLLALSANASAAITHNVEPFSPLDGSGSGKQLVEPGGIAIDETAGNAFVTDGSASGVENERVAIFGDEGGPPSDLNPPYEITGFQFGENNSSVGVAYDNVPTSPARGTLYVSDRSSPSIDKFVRNPATKRYEPAGTIAIPNGKLPAAVSLDRDGNIYVSASAAFFEDGSNIFKFAPGGALLENYEFGAGENNNPLSGPGQIAVDAAGDLFVVGVGSGLFELPANGSGEIDPTNYRTIVTGFAEGVAIDPTNEHLYVSLSDHISEYDTAGTKIDDFGAGTVRAARQVAVDIGTGRIYAADGATSSGGNRRINVFGPAVVVPGVGIGAATNVTGTKATLNGSVDPVGMKVTECFFEWGETTNYGNVASCEGTIGEDAESHPVSANISGLESNGRVYHYRLVAKNKNGTEQSTDKTFSTLYTVATEPATDLNATTAILNGNLRPEGRQFTSCFFEYGLTSSAGFEHKVACNPPATEVEADFSVHPVSNEVGGLVTNSEYKVRLTATNNKGTLSGKTLIFTTVGPPQISEVRARDADQSSVTLEAKIDPRGFGTSYHFEWGTTTAYGNSVPVNFEPYVGSGESPVLVTGKLTGLAPGTEYHYRIVARSEGGVTPSPDHVAETLNSCGLPEARCFELVSRRDAGPVAYAIRGGGLESGFQVAPEPGNFSYTLETGYPDATKGAEVVYTTVRGPDGWIDTQLSPALTARTEFTEDGESPSSIKAIGPNLSCDVVNSNQPLTSDASTRLVVESGGANLFRKNPDGSYTAISKVPPENPRATGNAIYAYAVYGMSADCSRVVFGTPYRYPGLPGTYYEWDRGTLRNFGFVPGPSGEIEDPNALPGAAISASSQTSNVISEDGRRLFFTAERKVAPNPEEVGKKAVFVRERDGTTRDLSLSETAVPDEGATYQSATKDGSRVFFTANAGLTAESSLEGTDLYEYDLESGNLTDLSVDAEEGGAAVTRFIGASRDGSHVYYVARGQLVPGRGKTLAQNLADNTASIYSVIDGKPDYVASMSENTPAAIDINPTGLQTARVSPDGRFLLFETTEDITRFRSQGHREAYLYDSDDAGEPVACVSCNQDGSAPSRYGAAPLESAPGGNPLSEPPSLAVHDGNPIVIFTSYNDLAPGSTKDLLNGYEWSHGQVFRLTTEPAGLKSATSEYPNVRAFGASADGTDLYFQTQETLNWEDGDERASVYDARLGGGFTEPPAPPAPCNPLAGGACQTETPQTGAGPAAASSTFIGPGNTVQKKKHRKPKKRHKQHGKSKQHGKKRHGKGRANGDRGASK